MKRVVFLSTIIALLFSVSVVFAGVVYVSSFRTSMYQNPASSAKKVMNLRRGYRLVVLSKSGSWLKVRFGKRTGYVKKLFTRRTRPGARVSILGSVSKAARLHARKRASSDVTAASARGLLGNNSRTRDVDRSHAYDPAALSRMESMHIPENDLLKFLADGGIKVNK